jgi:putative membrane protein
MVYYNPKNWFGLIFQFHKSDTFRQMFWVLMAMAVYSGIVVYLELNFVEWFGFKSTVQIHSLLGFVIGLFLVFRTNTAYERWSEGRKQWGSLVNASRNFSLKLSAHLAPEALEDRRYFADMIGDYAFAMKEHLRQGVIPEEMLCDENKKLASEAEIHIPNHIAQQLYAKLIDMRKKELISSDQYLSIDLELREFTNAIGACERIRNTPIPYSYSLFIKKFIFIYTLTMPFGLVYDFNYWTIPIVCFVLYVFGSIELLAEEIEDPFGRDANDLPTDDISNRIRLGIKELYGVQ